MPPISTGPTASQLFQQAAVSQLLQQATAAAAAQPQPNQASGSHMLQTATSPWPATAVARPAASVAPAGASLAALVPHVPQVVPHVHPAVAAAIAAAAAAPKSEAAAPSAGDWLFPLSDIQLRCSCAVPSRYSLYTSSSSSSSAGMYMISMTTKWIQLLEAQKLGISCTHAAYKHTCDKQIFMCGGGIAVYFQMSGHR